MKTNKKRLYFAWWHNGYSLTSSSSNSRIVRTLFLFFWRRIRPLPPPRVAFCLWESFFISLTFISPRMPNWLPHVSCLNHIVLCREWKERCTRKLKIFCLPILGVFPLLSLDYLHFCLDNLAPLMLFFCSYNNLSLKNFQPAFPLASKYFSVEKFSSFRKVCP